MSSVLKVTGKNAWLVLACLVAQLSWSSWPALAQDVLQGGVSESQTFPGQGQGPPGGGGQPFQEGADAFGEEQEDFQGGPPMQDQRPMAAAPPPQMPFTMQAEETEMQGMPEQPMQAPPSRPLSASATSNDPDNTPEMQLLWDAWHRRVANTIFNRFNFFAKAAFKHSRPLLAKVSYRVSKDGKISDVQMIQNSSNVFFNLLISQVVKSLNGDVALLQFPPGSRRTIVNKTGTFTQNYGAIGFRHTVGDRERITGQ